MTIVDPATLALCRSIGRCEFCGKTNVELHAHHVFRKGLGGGGRLDVRENLVALCVACHLQVHYKGHPNTHDLLAIIAKRERKSVAEIQEHLWHLRRLDKYGNETREKA